jgi:hypothetical protein
MAAVFHPSGIAVNHVNYGNRIVLIPGTAQPSKKPALQKTTRQQPSPRRIVVIKNGQLVGSAGQ